MKCYSTNNRNVTASLKEAVVQGLAPDGGLYMPETIPVFSADFFRELPAMSFREIALAVAEKFCSDEIPRAELSRIIDHTIQFDAPLVEVGNNTWALELFHGPTLAFKDFGARFMSQLLGYFASQVRQEIVILVATSGDTGSAVANGFLGVKGVRVMVLYPAGKVSDIQEKQFTTLGQNITAFEVDGTFDDCQRLVKKAFADPALREAYFLTSANSINIARLIPQSFYYFHAWARRKNPARPVVFSVPSGNFGNLTGGLIAKKMGLPVHRFVAATNVNDVVPVYLQGGNMVPRPSKHTLSNAMDVGDPSNFARLLDLYNGDRSAMMPDLKGYAFTDAETQAAMRRVSGDYGYTLDPHGAIAYLGLKKFVAEELADVDGIFLETAHPAKFREVVEETLRQKIALPEKLQHFMKGKKQTLPLSASFDEFRTSLLKL